MCIFTYTVLGGLAQMTDYIANINSNKIGGKNFDGQWVDVGTPFFVNITFAANASRTYSLEDILPNDGYTYLCQFDCWVRTGSTSGNTAQVYVLSGTGSDVHSQFTGSMAAVRTRSSSTRAEGGNCIIPIFPDDRNVTWYNWNGSGTSGNCGLYLKRYRRLGTNE